MLSISPQLYLFIYFHCLFLVVLITIYKLSIENNNGTKDRTGAFLFALFILLFIGLRPINVTGVGFYFGDTINYYHSFVQYAADKNQEISKDPGFGLFTKLCANHLTAQAYFFILAALYVVPLFLACRRLSVRYTFLLFLMLCASFLFWSSGVNGIRIGIATSFLILGFTYKKQLGIMLLLFAIGISFHKSALLPLGAFVLSLFYKNTKAYLVWWLSSILLSHALGSFWENLFASFNLEDDRLAGYLTSKADPNVFAHTGFRWDFLIYSAIPILLGAYFIFKRHYKTELYIQLFNTYLVANSFWILVIRANFSNRFASLSWFIIPILLILPLIKVKFWENQKIKISLILFLNFAFTYFMSFSLLWRN